MFVNGANKSQLTSDNVGVYFSDTAVTGMPAFALLPFTPQIVNPSGTVIDTLLWKSVNGSYVAHGGESYLIIGNFLDNASTHTFPTYSPGAKWHNVYFYIDDVSLTEIDVQEINLGSDTSLCQGESLWLNASPAFESYSWQDSSISQTFLFDDKALGNYDLNVIAIDTNGCIATDTITCNY